MKNIKRLAKLLRAYKTPLMAGSFFLILYSATNLAIPLFIKELVDVVMVQKNLAKLNQIAGAIALLFLSQMVFSTVSHREQARQKN